MYTAGPSSSVFDKEQPTYDGSIDVDKDAGDTINELSISQAILEEAPLPDNMDHKRSSVNTLTTPKDFPLSAQIVQEHQSEIKVNTSPDRHSAFGQKSNT